MLYCLKKHTSNCIYVKHNKIAPFAEEEQPKYDQQANIINILNQKSPDRYISVFTQNILKRLEPQNNVSAMT